MTPTEPRLQAALDAAIYQVRATLTSVVARLSEQLGTIAQSSTRIAERDLMLSTQIDLRRNASTLLRTFSTELSERAAQTLAPREEPKRSLATASWQTLSLVDDHEVEGRMYADRIGQQISHACESELRDLAAYMGSLLQIGHADLDRNPLRAEVLGASLYLAIEASTPQADACKLLARELGSAFAKAMPECYAQIVRDLQGSGLQPVELTVRQVEGPGTQMSGIQSGYSTLSGTRSQSGELDSVAGSFGARGATRSGRGPGYAPAGTYPLSAGRAQSLSGLHSAQADAQLMALLRQLTALASHPGDLDPPRGTSGGALGPLQPRTFGPGASRGERSAGAPLSTDDLTEMMAVNLIRAHRDELLLASGGKLDHMVIDVVGSLFDQILSDARVPPQMARQIARLQLPVLRVALSDSTFFSSRRHPVRRFVNRIASLACAFDDFSDGPGKHFLDRVRELVQEIVEGDFDQIDLYSAKLAALEAFIAEQAQHDAQQHGAVQTLGGKEAELRLQQRYMLQLQGSLTALPLPEYMRSFLAHVWSQALVLAVSRDGADSDRAKRYRRVGRDLVMSVQPKGSPPLRKRFLMQLPALMKDLNEGMALVGWPATAQREFFAQLTPGHAESLKAPPQSELDHNMMVKQLEAIFNTPVPAVDSLSPADPVPEMDSDALAQRFSEEEVQRIGLVTESAVNWSQSVDIDLGAELPGESPNDSTRSSPISLTGVDVDLSLAQADPAEPSRGAALFDHIKLGFAYQMHLKDEWQKVRLSHVSAGRGFFVFTRGKKHQETISMTARMLARMCESGRFRAVESAYLMERATMRARKQLAALGTPTRS